MNYKKLYKTFIDYCKDTTPIYRMLKRNQNDFRKNKEIIYTEKHHIIPVKCGGKDNKENIIELLPEEHIFAHQLRFKAFNNRVDILAVRGCLNKHKFFKKNKNDLILNKKILSGYAWIKQNSYILRLNNSWHTQKGLENISNSKKGKIVVKDVKTGKIIGMVNKNCENVKKW